MTNYRLRMLGLDRVSRKFTAGTYRGLLNGLIPVDMALSLLAKRNYWMYRLWERYFELTNGLFESHAPSEAGFPAHLLATLREQGFATQNDAFPPDQVEETRAFILDRYERARPKLEGAPSARWVEDDIIHEFDRRSGRMRFMIAPDATPRLPALMAQFRDFGPHHALAEAYFGTSNILSSLPYFMAEVLTPAEYSDTWHVDCIRPTLKTFMYLTDVGASTAPFRIIPGSHVTDPEKHALFFDVCRGGLAAGYVDLDKNPALDKQGHPVVAPGNTICFFDTRCLHAASPIREGLRVVLVNGYRPRYTTRLNPRLFRDPEPGKMPFERPREGSNA